MVGSPLARQRLRLFALLLHCSTLLPVSGTCAASAGSWEWLTLPQGPGEMVGPTSLAAASDGTLFAADQWSSQIQGRDPQGRWSVLATIGPDLGQVSGPSQLSVSADGTLYVLDSGNRRLQARSRSGQWQIVPLPRSYGPDFQVRCVSVADDGGGYLAAATDDQIQLWRRNSAGNWSDTGIAWPWDGWQPRSITADSMGGLYVVESPGGPEVGWRLQRLDAGGSLGTVSLPGGSGDSGTEILGVALSPQGDLYVSTRGADGIRLQRRDTSGAWSRLPLPAEGLGGNASGLAADGAGVVYIVDGSTGCVWTRSAQGTWRRASRAGSAPGQPSTVLTRWTVDTGGRLYLSQGTGGGWLNLPAGGVSVTAGDYRLDVRSPSGEWTRAARNGGGVGNVFQVRGLAPDSNGHLYLSEGSPLNRMQRRDSQGRWSVLEGATPEGEAPGTWVVQSMATDGAWSLWVAETGSRDGKTMVRVRQRGLIGSWQTVLEEDALSNPSPRLASGVPGACYLWSPSYGSELAAGEKGVQYVGGGGLPELGAVQCLAPTPDGGFYLVTRGTKELWRLDAQGARTRIASSGDGLGLIPSDANGLYLDGLGRVFVGNDHGIQRYTPPSALVRGDVDGDGQVAIADALYALKVVAGLTKGTPTVELRGDVWPSGGGDGKLSIADVARLLRYLAGLETRP